MTILPRISSVPQISTILNTIPDVPDVPGIPDILNVSEVGATSRSNQSASKFSELDNIPLDPHYALKEDFANDSASTKVILGSGIYRDDNGNPWVLPTIQEAEERLKNSDSSSRYDYLLIPGYEPFYNAARDILFGRHLTLQKERIVSVQTIAGTGANFLGARFLAQSLKPGAVWLSDPSWVNHANIWESAGVRVRYYPYWDSKEKCLDFDKMVQTLQRETRAGDVIVLHACAHNPTGVDLSPEQWKWMADACQRWKLFPFFDCAYQGFASGDLEKDASALRYFAEHRIELAAGQSFSKYMGLYGERVGALHIYVSSPEQVPMVKGHLLHLQRGQISQPPKRGAKLVAEILLDNDLFSKWLSDLKEMSSRIQSMREALHNELVSLETPGNWDHILTQIGMFSYTGLTAKQVENMQAESHVYILKSGRISIPGLNHSNVKYVARAIDRAVRAVPQS